MAVETSALRVTELDFFSIRENLKNFLRSQDEFTDYDFEGSGMSILLDILAYNTHYMGYYLNMVGNEMFLDTAQIRSSVLSHAKHIGYVPNSNQGASAKVDIEITPSNSEDQDRTYITLEPYTRLLGTDIDGVNYPFVTLHANTALKESESFTLRDINIKQGEVVTRQFIMDPQNEHRTFIIPSSNVDTTTIRVAVQESVSNATTEIYTRNEDITEIDGTSPVYFLEENENLTYTLQFGDNTIGKRPKNGNVIIVTYLDNVGSLANNITKFAFVDPISGYADNIVVDSDDGSYGGVEKETIEQVRFRSPYFYSAQNRAVNVHDYETLLVKNYNYIEAISVWGGEDNDPVVYGKVFASIKTKGNYQLTNFEKERLKSDLIHKYNMMTVTPEIIDPNYVYLGVDVFVNYNADLTNLSSGEIENRVRLAIAQYNEDRLNSFGSIFKKAELQRYIENADPSIQSSELSVTVQKQQQIDLIRPKTYEIAFNMKLARAGVDQSITTYPYIELRDANGISRQAYLEEIPEVLSGLHKINILSTGRNYLSAPTIIITGDGSGATAIAKIAAGRITGIEITNPGQNYSYAIITITSDSGEGGSANVTLQRDVGRLRSIFYSNLGEKITLKNDVGTIDYRSGLITLNALRVFSVEANEFYLDNYLVVTARAGTENIFPLRNRILSIDVDTPRSVQVEAVAV